MRRRSLAALAAVLVGLGIPALAAATTVGSTRLAVTPAHPGTRTDVVVSFTQPTISGLIPGQVTHESLQVSGPARTGCASGIDRVVPTDAAGTQLREVLSPAQMTGRRWCTGLHHVALTVTTSSSCSIGPQRQICPQYVLAPVTVATASFRITTR